ncbi:hypothetical protein FH968_19750 [Buttiauxella sp. B2]|uniref:hypothetical protein n=1 Tax=Buttiauxella sp. B2 TaxID=2587812 RepID=UPI001120801F|nr:hypothetical protein [Buttiauxella sp. B2]TNV16079.1 hypothetical protein FH968_19750 [Buttiauxella sp. B2]
MAGWWMAKGQLKILREMSAGAMLRMDSKGRFFLGLNVINCTVSAKALLNKSYIAANGISLNGFTTMHITPTGKNEMGYNRHQEI